MCTELYQDSRPDGDPETVRRDSQDPDADQGKPAILHNFLGILYGRLGMKAIFHASIPIH